MLSNLITHTVSFKLPPAATIKVLYFVRHCTQASTAIRSVVSTSTDRDSNSNLNKKTGSTYSSLKDDLHYFTIPSVQPRTQLQELGINFRKPKLFTFDAFGTLYHPLHSTAYQYCKVSNDIFGYNVPLEYIEQNFLKSFYELEAKHPNYGKRTGLKIHDWWYKLVEMTFLKYEISPECINFILEYFLTKQPYYSNNDLIPFLIKLKQNNIISIVISNADTRVKYILDSFKVLDFFKDVFVSYDTEILKPDPRIFKKVTEKYFPGYKNLNESSKLIINKRENFDNTKYTSDMIFWHIGDDIEKDFHGSVNSGRFGGILLDRHRQSKYFDNVDVETEYVIVDDKRIVVTSLIVLGDIFPLK